MHAGVGSAEHVGYGVRDCACLECVSGAGQDRVPLPTGHPV